MSSAPTTIWTGTSRSAAYAVTAAIYIVINFGLSRIADTLDRPHRGRRRAQAHAPASPAGIATEPVAWLSVTTEEIARAEAALARNYHPLPVVVAEGKGAWVTDVEGAPSRGK
ncbi:hypothetical protein LWP59_22805 [Amycolatopsis acidiphila]|uniref:Uncharacterized protein n=1 Tax=Amycolatopsis acidiphila TaxID=715473 RepID=A0A558A879_9PSEU|nr:hypothetical protein [Amycolatopsis acidiphila]TVT20467.1 hypothetical protein FNH06_20185 [Amycolatopsis acidiphila]UIJ56989.1 hypothetical protein LWP59_22805 [Amycolatopsis acidiphila]